MSDDKFLGRGGGDQHGHENKTHDQGSDTFHYQPLWVRGERKGRIRNLRKNGVAFSTMDEIALSMGFDGDSPCRVEAALTYELSHNLNNGHVFLPRDKLLFASAQLIGGNPGAGKSTLLLQTLCKLAEGMKTLYVTGEESLQQVAMRAHRLGLPTANLNMLSETSIEQICQIADEEKPQLMVIDSIQVMHMADVQSSPGSVAQVRETAAYLTRFAKTRGVAIVMVGHVTKDGSLAGPKVLEHCIDCSVLLDGDADSRFRTLRSHKNRFGAVNELGVFAMTEQGLREVSNPSAIFLSRGDEITSGSSVMVVWEGTRPLLVEIQALVDHSMMSNPRRVAVGLEQNRLAILLAVLHRHGGLQMADQDVFVNVVGGVKVTETSADLALLLAMVSSLRDRRCRRIWWSLAKSGWPGKFARCRAVRSVYPKRRSMVSAAPSSRRPMCRKKYRKACKSLV